MYTMGLDIGSTASKGLILKDGKEIVAYSTISSGTGTSGPARVLEDLYKKLNIKGSDIQNTVVTGYGRMKYAETHKQISELSCHTKGVKFLVPTARTVIDIGGQDAKALKLDNNGVMLNFLMNDKCAAGTGRFLQVMVNLLGSDISKIDELAKDAKPQSISSMCTVFGESEVVSLLAQGASKESVASGILQSICNKAGSLLDKLKIEGDLAFTGGLAASSVLTQMISKKTKREIYVSSQSQFVGALGAAIIAMNLK